MFYTNRVPEVQEDDVPEASSDAGEICPGTVQVKENTFSWYRKVLPFARSLVIGSNKGNICMCKFVILRQADPMVATTMFSWISDPCR